MTIDIERLEHDLDYWNSVAPKGATHYAPKQGNYLEGWYRKSNNVINFVRNRSGIWAHGTSFENRTTIPRPAPKCSGDGLPPVGTVAVGNMPAWREEKKCLVVAHAHDSCVVVYGLGDNPDTWTALAWCDTFRPLPTEKDKVVEAVMKHMPHPASPSTKTDLKAAYDAGFLRMPEGE